VRGTAAAAASWTTTKNDVQRDSKRNECKKKKNSSKFIISTLTVYVLCNFLLACFARNDIFAFFCVVAAIFDELQAKGKGKAKRSLCFSFLCAREGKDSNFRSLIIAIRDTLPFKNGQYAFRKHCRIKQASKQAAASTRSSSWIVTENRSSNKKRQRNLKSKSQQRDSSKAFCFGTLPRDDSSHLH